MKLKIKKLHISFVLPIYNESGNIPLLLPELENIRDQLKGRYHTDIVFINDGSRDNSLELLEQAHHQDKSIKVINFSRNFGHQAAVTAGIDYAKGDAVIIMDSDMQDPPAVTLELIKEWEKGYHVVYAQRRTRQDTFFKRATANAFYRILKALANIDIPRNTGDFRLLDRQVVDELQKFGEYNRFLRGMVSFVGFKQKAVLFDRHERASGETGYSLGKMLKLAFDGITSFSVVPLKLITVSGMVVSFLSALGILYVIGQKLLYPETVVSGFAFTMVVLFFLGGIQILMLGIMGAYVGRIYTEVQRRPIYIVEKIHE